MVPSGMRSWVWDVLAAFLDKCSPILAWTYDLAPEVLHEEYPYIQTYADNMHCIYILPWHKKNLKNFYTFGKMTRQLPVFTATVTKINISTYSVFWRSWTPNSAVMLLGLTCSVFRTHDLCSSPCSYYHLAYFTWHIHPVFSVNVCSFRSSPKTRKCCLSGKYGSDWTKICHYHGIV